MGFISTGSNGSGSGSLSAVIASVNPPLDKTKVWLDLSNKPVFRKYNNLTNLWEISEGDINDNSVSEQQTWSSQQIADNSGYEFNQSTPSDVWVIDHELDRMPSVHVIDDTGEEVVGEVSFESSSRIVIVFSEPISGKAYLS